MFNSLHLVHIIALLQEESLLDGDKMETESQKVSVAPMTSVLRTFTTLILLPSLLLQKKKN